MNYQRSAVKLVNSRVHMVVTWLAIQFWPSLRL